MPRVLLLSLLLSGSSFAVNAQSRNLFVGLDFSEPIDQFRDLGHAGFGGLVGYQWRTSPRFATLISAEYLSFGERTVTSGSSWVSTKTGLLNFKLAEKFYLFNSGDWSRVYFSAEVGSASLFIKGESNAGFGTTTKTQTDLSYAPGFGYTTGNGKFDFWVTFQFISVSGDVATAKVIDYTSLKVCYNFLKR